MTRLCGCGGSNLHVFFYLENFMSFFVYFTSTFCKSPILLILYLIFFLDFVCWRQHLINSKPFRKYTTSFSHNKYLFPCLYILLAVGFRQSYDLHGIGAPFKQSYLTTFPKSMVIGTASIKIPHDNSISLLSKLALHSTLTLLSYSQTLILKKLDLIFIDHVLGIKGEFFLLRLIQCFMSSGQAKPHTPHCWWNNFVSYFCRLDLRCHFFCSQLWHSTKSLNWFAFPHIVW